jgi:hypothetical protein
LGTRKFKVNVEAKGCPPGASQHRERDKPPSSPGTDIAAERWLGSVRTQVVNRGDGDSTSGIQQFDGKAVSLVSSMDDLLCPLNTYPHIQASRLLNSDPVHP